MPHTGQKVRPDLQHLGLGLPVSRTKDTNVCCFSCTGVARLRCLFRKGLRVLAAWKIHLLNYYSQMCFIN